MRTLNPLPSKSDWEKVKYFPVTVNYDREILPRILEAQEFDLSGVLGRDFYAEFVLTVDNGGAVPETVAGFDQDGFDAIEEYLKNIIMHHAYARHISEGNEHETKYGQVVKKNPHSEPIDSKNKDRKIREARAKAIHYTNELLFYLDENSANYSDWGDKIESTSLTKGSIRGVWGNDV